MPIFSFGENDLFDQVDNSPGSWLRRTQNRLQKIMRVSLPLFHGRGVFQYSFGLMPYRQPITTVGEPRPRLGWGSLQGKGPRLCAARGHAHGPDTSLTLWNSHSRLGNSHTGRYKAVWEENSNRDTKNRSHY